MMYQKLCFCCKFRTRTGESPHVRESLPHMRQMLNFEGLVLLKKHVQENFAARAGEFAARAGLTAARAAHAEKHCLLRFTCRFL